MNVIFTQSGKSAANLSMSAARSVALFSFASCPDMLILCVPDLLGSMFKVNVSARSLVITLERWTRSCGSL